MARLLTTREVARIVGVSRVTIQKWIRQGRIQAPSKTFQGRRVVRLWSKRHVEEVTRYYRREESIRAIMRNARAEVKKDKAERKARRLAKLNDRMSHENH